MGSPLPQFDSQGSYMMNNMSYSKGTFPQEGVETVNFNLLNLKWSYILKDPEKSSH